MLTGLKLNQISSKGKFTLNTREGLLGTSYFAYGTIKEMLKIDSPLSYALFGYLSENVIKKATLVFEHKDLDILSSEPVSMPILYNKMIYNFDTQEYVDLDEYQEFNPILLLLLKPDWLNDKDTEGLIIEDEDLIGRWYGTRIRLEDKNPSQLKCMKKLEVRIFEKF